VENASLLPWLIGTAFLHSAMIQERRGMLKVWNASLILATGILSILGTFLVRSGILDSIHAFVQEGNTIAWAFTALIVVMVAGSVYLVVTRANDALRSEARIDSLLSREAMFLANNVVFVAIAFVVFLGTFYPLITDALGEKRALGPPWFDDYIVPFVLVLVLLSGIGPVVAWRRSTASRLWRSLRIPVIVAAAVMVLAALFGDATSSPLSLVMFVVGAFAISVGLQELWRGTRARQAMTGEAPPAALVGVVRRNRRRYGGYIVHIGIAVLFIGVAASSAFKHERDVRLRPGETARVGGYVFKYERPTARIAQRAGELERIVLGSRVRVEKDGKTVAVLRPERGYYPINAPMMGALSRYFEGNATSEIGLKAGLRRDIWIAEQPDIDALTPIIKKGDQLFAKAGDDLTADQRAEFLGQALIGLVARYRDSAPAAQFRVLVSPLITFHWLGALIALCGGLLAAWPEPGALRGRVRAGYAVRVARDLGRAKA
jgi:cytochrome c-type biogenesis protein CcmF